jgi:inorganic triphosphatase YgiF
VERRTLRLEHLGADIEVCLDQGHVRREGEPRVFAEVELELKRGEPAALFDLALALQDSAPLRLSFKTKADRGYEALVDEPPRRVKAAPVSLRRGMTSAEGFQAIAAACLRHLLDNEPVLRGARDAEAVHQMRVALRRLRAACTIFKGVVVDDAFDMVRAELKWMAGELGAARDLDVFIGKVLDPARGREEPEIRALIEDYDARRARAYEAAQGLVASERFLRGVLRVAAWAEAGAWTARASEEGSPAARPVRKLARDQLSRRWRRIRKSARHLDRLDPEARHEVRIEIKKLRYAAEFFEGLFDKRGQQRRRRAALAVLSELQDTLGDLNDIAVAEGEAGSGALRALQAGEAGRADALLARAMELHGEFAELEPFWE